MQAGKPRAKLAAMVGVRPARAHALQVGYDDRWLALYSSQRLSVARGHWSRSGKALFCKVAHQLKKEGQVLRFCASFEDSEDEAAFGRFEQEVRVLDALGNPLER